MVGRILGNRYEILDRIGGGGMAIVYKGKDTMLNRLITVKVLRSEYACDEDFVRRFRREAQSVASLSHHNIVSIYDVGQEEDICYLVMEYVDGENLKDLVRREGVLPIDKSISITIQICNALEHAHEHNIIHRDVKPHNILITKTGEAKLTDFGISMEAGSSTMTNTESILGSVHYISPEQTKGVQASRASDIYSMGVVMYEMVTGKIPFEKDSPVAVALAHVQEQPTLPSKLSPMVSPVLEGIILKAMDKVPEKRFFSCTEFSDQLKKLMNARKMGDSYDSFSDEKTMVLTNLPKEIDNILNKSPNTQQNKETKELKEAKKLQGKKAEARKAVDINSINGISNSSVYRVGGAKKNPEKNKSHVGLWMLLLIMGFAVAFGGSYVFFERYLGNAPSSVAEEDNEAIKESEVPALLGLTQEEAEDLLKDNDLGIKVIEDFSDEETGIVIAQDYEAGTMVKKGRIITITISRGSKTQEVPNVVGKTLAQATTELSKFGFKISEGEKEYSDDIEEGFVCRQAPGSGQEMKLGSQIVVYISMGQDTGVSVPSLIGMSQNDALLTLRDLELDASVIEKESSEYFSGKVIGQDPSQGSSIEKGEKVEIIVSSGPGPSSSMAELQVNVPTGEDKYEVQIVVSDSKSSSNVIYNATHNSGDSFLLPVEYWGQATVKILMNGNLQEEKYF